MTEQTTRSGLAELIAWVRDTASARLAANHYDGEAAVLLGLCNVAEREVAQLTGDAPGTGRGDRGAPEGETT